MTFQHQGPLDPRKVYWTSKRSIRPTKGQVQNPLKWLKACRIGERSNLEFAGLTKGQIQNSLDR